MQLILMVVESIGLVIGSLAAAVLLCSFLWYAFVLVRHPEWGASVILILVGLALIGELPHGLFLDMTFMFAVIAALPLWIAGRAWRKQSQKQLDSLGEEVVTSSPQEGMLSAETEFRSRIYPAITACICEERSPSRDEVHLVASRLWREAFAHRFGSQNGPASFAARRVLLRAAIAALRGKGVESGVGRGAIEL